jgi:hypothetical protein
VNPLPLVSFIIPVRDDAARLRRCLQSVARNNYPAERLEVIVADNGSVDDSGKVAADHGARVLFLPDLRVSELRNRAAMLASGHVLAFVDADHEITPDWVSIAVENLRQPNVEAVGASYHPPKDATWVQRLYDALRSHSTGRRDTLWLGSGNMAVRREAFGRVGGFDATLETCEDVDLCRRLRLSRARVVSDPRLWSVHHGDPATLKAVFLGESWRGRDNFRVSLRRPLSWSTLVSLAVPLVSVTALAGLAAGLLMAATVDARKGFVLAGAAVCVLLSMILLRAGRMLHNLRPVSVSDVLRAPAVASCYELGRALAPVLRTTHGRRRVAGARRWQDGPV